MSSSWTDLSFGIGPEEVLERVKEMINDKKFMKSEYADYRKDDWNISAPDIDNESMWLTLGWWACRKLNKTPIDDMKRYSWFLKARWDNYRRTEPEAIPHIFGMLDIEDILYDTAEENRSLEQRQILDAEQQEALLEFIDICGKILFACTSDDAKKIDPDTVRTAKYWFGLSQKRKSAVLNNQLFASRWDLYPTTIISLVFSIIFPTLTFGLVLIMILYGFGGWAEKYTQVIKISAMLTMASMFISLGSFGYFKGREIEPPYRD
jgi:hypothetical protein